VAPTSLIFSFKCISHFPFCSGVTAEWQIVFDCFNESPFDYRTWSSRDCEFAPVDSAKRMRPPHEFPNQSGWRGSDGELGPHIRRHSRRLAGFRANWTPKGAGPGY